MVTNLYLIRHGESFANVEPIIGGMRGDSGLTPLGHRQAALLEQRLAVGALRVDVLYTSTLPRALQTAEYVARALGQSAIPDDDWQELRPGEADGLSTTEWQQRYGVAERIRDDPFCLFSPGGESWAIFLARAGAALNRVVERHPGQTVAVICHGGILSASFFHAAGLGPTASRQLSFDPHNTSITHWRFFPPHADTGRAWDATVGPRWSLVTFNDAAHLEAERLDGASHEAVPTPVEERPS